MSNIYFLCINCHNVPIVTVGTVTSTNEILTKKYREFLGLQLAVFSWYKIGQKKYIWSAFECNMKMDMDTC